jgi:hypothetical protein
MNLPSYVGCHEVLAAAAPVAAALLQQLFVELESHLDVFRRYPPDGEADMVQDIVPDGHRLVDQIEPHTATNAPEVHERRELVDFGHESWNT